jgi:hypothetical protein
MSNIVTVDFRNDTLFAVERDDGVFVAVKPISDALGLKWASQHDRLNRDPILSEGILVMGIPSVGGMQETTCLKLELVNGWLFTIDESRVKDEETRQKVLAYKRECYQTLFRHFYGHGKRAQGETINPPQDTEEAEGPKVRLVTEARHTFGIQSAAQLWFKLGLPVVPAMLHDPRQISIDYSGIKPAEEKPAA